MQDSNNTQRLDDTVTLTIPIRTATLFDGIDMNYSAMLRVMAGSAEGSFFDSELAQRAAEILNEAATLLEEVEQAQDMVEVGIAADEDEDED